MEEGSTLVKEVSQDVEENQGLVLCEQKEVMVSELECLFLLDTQPTAQVKIGPEGVERECPLNLLLALAHLLHGLPKGPRHLADDLYLLHFEADSMFWIHQWETWGSPPQCASDLEVVEQRSGVAEEHHLVQTVAVAVGQMVLYHRAEVKELHMVQEMMKMNEEEIG